MEGLSRRVADFLNTSIERSGGVENALLGIDSQGTPRLVVVSDRLAGADLGLETLVTPGPFRNFQGIIREAFEQRSIQAALFWGEAWTFPPDDPEAINQHVREGFLPSQHPDRREIVLLSSHWPRGGVGWISAWRIVRPPTGAYLRLTWEQRGADPDNILTFFSSWVDDVLPHPLPGE